MNGFLKSSLAYLGLLTLASWPLSTAQAQTFWPRGDRTFLAAAQSMPLWLELPADTCGTAQDLVLKMECPKGFVVTSVGQNSSAPVQPKPLAVPSSWKQISDNGGHSWAFTLPASQFSGAKPPRLSLMVDPGLANDPGEYQCRVTITTADGGKAWAPKELKLNVLETPDGKRPARSLIRVFNYQGLEGAAFIQDLERAVLKSGITTICDMPGGVTPDDEKSFSARLKRHGLSAELYWFWHSFSAVRAKFPEAARLTKEGLPEKNGGLSPTWLIKNHDRVLPVLVESLRPILSGGRYRSLVNDNEEQALSREGDMAFGDIYNPGAVAEFAKWAGITGTVPADGAAIAQKFPQQWVEYRCWQSARMSALMAEAVAALDPSLGYGLYSGYEYTGKMEGRTKQVYSIDWPLLAREGKIQFGAAGYYGTAEDLKNTARALFPHTFVPSEMYVTNFDDTRKMPQVNQFNLRLMAAWLDSGGRGGINIWYLPVLDAAAYVAISRFSQAVTEIEDFPLDGTPAAIAELRLSPNVPMNNVYAYRLGQRRVIVVLNRSESQELPVKAGWRELAPRSDTVEVTSGRRLGQASIFEAVIPPLNYAIFLTSNDGN